uniref:NAC domain-containing protein n=1 Tax=Aegilops tauschii subsp. strangulata TaxID=200361 RepID=A0A453TCC0_AEGTS
MEEEEALDSLPGEHALVAVLRRHADTGELPAWVHEVNAYAASPVLLTAGRKKITAADGAAAWYLLYTPARKEGSSSRCSRTAGGATWIEERTRPVEKAGSDGGWVVIGHASTFSYGKRTRGPDKKRRTERLGWILVEVRLPGANLCCAKLYRSPRTPSAAALNAPPPPAAPSAALVPPPSAPAAVAPALEAPVPAPEATAPAPQAGIPARDATAPAPVARVPAPVAPAAAAVRSPLAPAAAARSPPAPAAVPAPMAPPAPADSSPGKTWVKVLVSNFPTRLTEKGMSKRVHKLLLPTEGALDSLPAKRRLLSCTGWLSINPLEGSA